MAFLPTTKAELAARSLDHVDFVIVTGDSYVDHPSFGTALIGRWLESQGYTVGVIARPDLSDVEAFRALGRPRLGFLVAGGAIDSMVCKYTANRKPRSEDEYAPGGDPYLCRAADGSLHGFSVNGKLESARPDKAVIAYCGRCREAFKGVPVIAGGLEASLRRLSHYDYLSDTVRKPIILDSKADLVVYGMGERAISEVAARLAQASDAHGGAAIGATSGDPATTKSLAAMAKQGGCLRAGQPARYTRDGVAYREGSGTAVRRGAPA